MSLLSACLPLLSIPSKVFNRFKRAAAPCLFDSPKPASHTKFLSTLAQSIVADMSCKTGTHPESIVIVYLPFDSPLKLYCPDELDTVL